MRHHDQATYPPLNTLKPVAEDVWIVDGPIIRFGMPWPKMPFPTRMTVIRIGRDLFIHSPTPLTGELAREIAGIGAPRWIIGPNRIHYWWIPDWHAAYDDAQVFLAPRIRQQAGGRIDFECETLDRTSGYPWDEALATLPVVGEYMTEMVFFHRPSRTLVLTDLIENFEPAKLGSILMRWLTRLGGVQDPDGQMPRDMRLTYAANQAGLKAAVKRMVEWDPERIILAHGRWYHSDGKAELERAFRWLR
ncbi:DUF4336 domain-containing protein [Devosia nitrariae]|uniref:DUF4336 domain-containing protein n=1 Tax=Devosia nitrariae TaxID=2071872 RepID=A0ABQ5W6I6_9HYPH|nr:DUF4336 domain-containing protein [Devosia nitrariae]GLQ55518.1 hypothetical protein GCM10010862_27770 [Devosia nitrariae]